MTRFEQLVLLVALACFAASAWVLAMVPPTGAALSLTIGWVGLFGSIALGIKAVRGTL